MRGLVVWVALAGCGRIGFGDAAQNGDGGPIDGPPIDTPIGLACTTDQQCGRCARCDASGTCQVEPVTKLFLGHRSLCYLGANGERWCAGENNGGQLGLGDADGNTNRAFPERALDGGGWETIYLFYYGNAIATRGNQEWQWGGGVSLVPTAAGAVHPALAGFGDLAFTSWWELDHTSSLDPTGTVWASLDYGADHACGVTGDGKLACWGTSRNNSLGQVLADGTMVTNPVQVGSDANWQSVAVGGDLDKGFSCGLKVSGKVFCWGHPWFTGTGDTDVGAVPSEIAGQAQYKWIDADFEHICGGTPGGEVLCWGHDSYGGFVTPGMTSASVPKAIIGGPWAEWVMGGHHACGKTTAGRWRCFGWNEQGQLGNGTFTNDGAMTDLCP
jgi:alpha-tubulin suppressor-like RCC1 family protein